MTVSQTGDRKGPWVVTLKSGTAAASVPQPRPDADFEREPARENAGVQRKIHAAGEARLTWEIRAADGSGTPYSSGVYSLLKDSVEHTFEGGASLPGAEGAALLLAFLRSDAGSAGVAGDSLPGHPGDAGHPLLHADGSVNYLLRYPYGCLEQLSSSTLPWIYEPLLAKYLPGFKENRRRTVPGPSGAAFTKS